MDYEGTRQTFAWKGVLVYILVFFTFLAFIFLQFTFQVHKKVQEK